MLEGREQLEIDGRSIADGSMLEGGVCIVGAGAAGISLARELARRGVSIILVESGGFSYDPATQDLGRGETAGHPYFPLDACRLRYFGGTTNHWVGWCRPLDPVDFEAKEWAPGTGWPLRPADLEDYYRGASDVCELTSLDYRAETWAAGLDRPLLPLSPDRIATTLFQLSPPTRFGARYRDDVIQSNRIRTLLYSNVVEIHPHQDLRFVERLRVRTLQGNEFSVVARHYVLATGGIENARLLLASRSVATDGLGNAYGWVGRTFMEHPHLVSGLFLPSNPDLDVSFYRVFKREGARANGALVFPASRLREEGMLNVSVTLEDVPRQAERYVEAELSTAFESFRALGRSARRGEVPEDFVRHLWNVVSDIDDVAWAGYGRLLPPIESGWMYKLFVRSEQEPNPDSRITLIDELDPLGVPRTRLDWRLTDLDLHTIRRAQTLLALEVGRAGLGRVFIPPAEGESTWADAIFGGYHHMGTTRMDPDLTRGVVDRDCRVHGIENLWIAGSSVFPSGGYANPTLTLIALALRLGDHLGRELS